MGGTPSVGVGLPLEDGRSPMRVSRYLDGKEKMSE